jgi:hypothetical protein
MTLDFDRFQGLAAFRFALRRCLAASERTGREAGVTQPRCQALVTIQTWIGEPMTI